jgi:hypothetical protein
MRFAYADPPYPGQAHKYRNHPDYAGEVDHGQLIARLEADYPDGWALSTSARALQQVLALCPPTVAVGVWHITNAEPPGNRPGRWWWCWEPVIVRGGRPGPVRNVLECGASGTAGRFIGAKPAAFTRWMLALLGARPEDTIDDLFSGSGAVGHAIESWRRQPVLPLFTVPEVEKIKRDRRHAARDMRLAGHEGLWSAPPGSPRAAAAGDGLR